MSRISFLFSSITISVLLLFMVFVFDGSADAELRRVENPSLSWVNVDLGYSSGPNLGGYRDFVNDYYRNLGSVERLSDFGGRLALNIGYKSFFSSHFAYGFFLTIGGFSTDQVFDYLGNDNQYYQALEEYRMKTGQFGFDMSFTPVNSKKTKIIPYVSAGGLLTSGVLDVLYSEDGPRGNRAWSYSESSFGVGYRVGGGLVIPISDPVALNTNTYFSYSKLKFDASAISDDPIDIKYKQWFGGIGLLYFFQ
jgi:hypothetical protein